VFFLFKKKFIVGLKNHEALMLIISRTPVRISLFGGGTDYPDYFSRKKGAVLGTTIKQFIYVSINQMLQMGSFFDHKIRVGYSKTELVQNILEIAHPSVRECLKHHKFDANLDIHIFSDLPAKTGLGSSSSFTVGFLNALYAIKGLRISKQKLAEEACLIEQTKIKEHVGSQDQFHAAHGGLNIIEFTQDEIKLRPVLVSKEKKKLFQDSVMVFYTGLTRFASEVAKEQIDKTKTLSNDIYLEKMHDMVFEAEKIFATCESNEMIQQLGSLLHTSWLLKKKLSKKISTALIDKYYETAIEAGAIGGKLCGAGSGGFLAMIVPTEKQPKVRNALKNLLEVPFQIEPDGSTIIYMKD